jgi:ABC-type uncharacterized transport system auxiliary subunit
MDLRKEQAMDRFARHSRRAALALLVALPLAVAGGCSILPFAAYLIKGISTPADFNGLKGKKVAVICRPVASLQYQSSSVATELAQRVADLLAEHVAKIEIVDQGEVEKWEDENNWEEYTDIGKALQADMVVGIDLDQFSLSQGQTLYQGKASIDLAVYDMKHGRRPVYQKTLPQQLYPPNAPIPAAEKSLVEFRQQFLQVLAEQIGRHFYEHDSTANFAIDSAAHK